MTRWIVHNGVAAIVVGAGVALAGGSCLAQESHDHAADGDAAEGMAERMERMDLSAAPALPTASDLVRVEHHPRERTFEIIVGPISLPAGGPHYRAPIQVVDIPIVGWMHGWTWEMRDGAGNPLPERLLHHVHLIDPDRRELFAGTPRRIVAAGRETPDVQTPRILGAPIIGYPLEPGTRVLVTTMFAPREDSSFDDAYLHLELAYTPANDHGLIAPRNIFPLYMDVMGPVGAKYFDLPPGTHVRSWEGRPAMSGRLLGLTAHLHDYADWIRLEDVTTGARVWEAVPERDESGRLLAVPVARLWWRGGLPIHSDHVYRLTVQYTNPLDVPAPDAAMGVVGGAILGDPDDWPPLDPTDPDYITDLRNTLQAPAESHEHTEH